MRKPVIGVTPQFQEDTGQIWMRKEYTEALLAAGGLPIVTLQYTSGEDMEVLLSSVDGILLTGGGDIHPRYFGGGDDTACKTVQPERDVFELELCRRAILRGKPVLGICRGIQVLNVAMGGTLCLNLSGHMGTEHEIGVEPESPFYRLLGDHAKVNSFHHQCIARCAPALRIAAVSGDGCPEAVWVPGCRFAAAVQWHPEYMFRTDPRQESIFRSFCDACR